MGILISLLTLLQKRTRPSPEQEIRNWLISAERAVESKNLAGLMALISPQYHDDNGFNRDKIRLLISRAFRETSDVWVTINAPSITLLPPNRAEVHVYATVEYLPRGETEPERNTVSLYLTLVQEPSRKFLFFPTQEWKLVSSEGWGVEDLEGW